VLGSLHPSFGSTRNQASLQVIGAGIGDFWLYLDEVEYRIMA
jgi:hypothetical protein